MAFNLKQTLKNGFTKAAELSDRADKAVVNLVNKAESKIAGLGRKKQPPKADAPEAPKA